LYVFASKEPINNSLIRFCWLQLSSSFQLWWFSLRHRWTCCSVWPSTPTTLWTESLQNSVWEILRWSSHSWLLK